jgi:hypothetical protein
VRRQSRLHQGVVDSFVDCDEGADRLGH